MRRAAALLVMILVLAPVAAQDGADVPLPRQRPAEPVAAVPLPAERPAEAEQPEISEAAEPADPSEPTPPRVYQAACPAQFMGRIEAEALPPIDEQGCGERSPLSVTAVLVNGRTVPLSGTPTLTCGMAGALPDWLEAVDLYLASREGTRISRVLTGTSYACRNRNNAAVGDLSEHAFANALDIVGFELEDGRTMALPAGWSVPQTPSGRFLRFAHDAACAHFTTTLGPEANALHADHLHIDLGCHGRNCTARLCE